MKLNYSLFPVTMAVAIISSTAVQAATITGATTVNQGATFTTTDNQLTLSAFSSASNTGLAAAPDVAGVLNTNAFAIGVSSSTNTAAVNQPEALDLAFATGSGLSQLEFQFSSANGPAATDGIQISGFLVDPGVTFVGATWVDVRWDNSLKSVFAELTTSGSTSQFLNFSSQFASSGQTLRLTANDSDTAFSQAGIRSLTYSPIPEPSTALLGTIGALVLLRRRRN